MELGRSAGFSYHEQENQIKEEGMELEKRFMQVYNVGRKVGVSGCKRRACSTHEAEPRKLHA